MSDSNGRHLSKVRGLGLLVAAAILFAGSAWVWNLGATRIALAPRGYPVAAPNCDGAKGCEQKAQVDARTAATAATAATADTALYIALGQLVASFLGLGGVGFTVFYARLAWREAERSANAAQEALDDTRTETAEQATRFGSQLKVAADAALASAKGAEAMERVAEAMNRSAKTVEENMTMLKERTAQQMRAYVTVLVGSAVFQERARGLKFQGKPIFLNTGATPAHKLRYRASCAVIDVASTAEFSFPLDENVYGMATLNSQQSLSASILLPDFIPDQDVFPVMSSIPRAFVVWGIVTYEDIFGEPHETKFGLVYYWVPNADPKGVPVAMGNYTKGHNEAD